MDAINMRAFSGADKHLPVQPNKVEPLMLRNADQNYKIKEVVYVNSIDAASCKMC